MRDVYENVRITRCRWYNSSVMFTADPMLLAMHIIAIKYK